MSKPFRVQLQRKRGYRMPPHTVKVARPGKWGNPFCVGGWYRRGDPDPSYRGPLVMIWSRANPEAGASTDGYTHITTARQAVEWHRWYVEKYGSQEEIRKTLRGKNLACFCPLDQPCHADTLLEIANA